MKKQNKKTIQIVVTVFVIVLCVGLLTSLSFTNTDSGDFVGGSSNNDESVDETVERSEGDPLCQHNYDAGVIEKKSTCTEQGVKVVSCTKCGKTNEILLELLDHVYSTLKKYSHDEHLLICSVCKTGDKYEEHIFVESSIAASCSSKGARVFECACGYERKEEIPATGHVVTNWVKKTSDNIYHYGVCSICADPVSKSHTFGPIEVVVEATCTESGLKRRTCSDCGYEKDFIIPSDHTGLHCEQIGSDTVHEVICSDCGISYEESHDDFGDYEYLDTDKHYASCGLCGQIVEQDHYVIYDSYGHPSCPLCNSDLG